MARTISRFGRTYVEYDPSGGNGPSTWILSSPGAGSSGGSSYLPDGLFQPATPGASVAAGQALFMPAVGELDLAIAVDGAAGQSPQPYQVIGLAASNATDGQRLRIVTDGQIQLLDWSAVTGTVDLQAGQLYYLSSTTAGRLQTAVPSGSGVTVAVVGRAMSSRILEIEIDVRVRLS